MEQLLHETVHSIVIEEVYIISISLDNCRICRKKGERL
jgi:hypothetical protein